MHVARTGMECCGMIVSGVRDCIDSLETIYGDCR